MEYGFPERRKTKGDKRAKARFNVYKKGGSKRSKKFLDKRFSFK